MQISCESTAKYRTSFVFELLLWFYFYALLFTTSILWVIVKETDAGNRCPFSSWEEGSDSHSCPVSPLYSRMQRVVVWNLNYCLISSFLKVSTYVFYSLTSFIWTAFYYTFPLPKLELRVPRIKLNSVILKCSIYLGFSNETG